VLLGADGEERIWVEGSERCESRSLSRVVWEGEIGSLGELRGANS
jgi:hypothetical protein